MVLLLEPENIATKNVIEIRGFCYLRHLGQLSHLVGTKPLDCRCLRLFSGFGAKGL